MVNVIEIGSRRLTLKEKKWLRAYFNHGNKLRAAKDAGYRCTSDLSYGEIGYQNFIKLEKYITEWLDKECLSETALKKKITELMQAKEKRFFAHEGVVVEEREVEALETQRRTLDMAIKVRGMYSPEKVEIKADNQETIEEIENDINRLEKIINNNIATKKEKIINDKKRSPATFKKKKKRPCSSKGKK